MISMYNTDFINYIKIIPDKNKEYLLKIQNQIEKKGINKKDIFEITKNLSDNQKRMLECLYIKQIEELKNSTEQYKRKILNIRKNIKHNVKSI